MLGWPSPLAHMARYKILIPKISKQLCPNGDSQLKKQLKHTENRLWCHLCGSTDTHSPRPIRKIIQRLKLNL
jgi:hypothetical protein